VDQPRHFADDDSIKAIIIHVNSPAAGGGVGKNCIGGQAHPRRKKKRIVFPSKPWARVALLWSLAPTRFTPTVKVVGDRGCGWVNYGDLMRLGQAKLRS